MLGQLIQPVLQVHLNQLTNPENTTIPMTYSKHLAKPNRRTWGPQILLSLGLIEFSSADLISYWPLDETAGDLAADVAGSNDANWQNPGVNLVWEAGRIGGAANLSDVGGAAANNFFQMNIPELVGADAITISLWINNRAQASSGYNGLFMTRTFNGATNNSWGLAIENNGNERLDSRVNGPGIDSANGLLADNGEWKHLVLVWDGINGTQTQYINGVETATGAAVIGPVIGPDSGPWYIGYDDCCGNTRDFDGLIDDVAVWNEVLSSTQIITLAGGVAADQLDSSDSDSDGMSDEYEDMFDFLDKNDGSDAALDEDDDGLTNLEEFENGTTPDNDDSDSDGLTDGDEVNNLGTNPNSDDTDGDTIKDGEELVAGEDGFITDPLAADTDMDGFPDSDEITNGTDPTDSADPPAAQPMLIGHWPLDESSGLIAEDLVNGNNGTWADPGGFNLEWTTGQIGGAARLSDLGGDNYFLIESIDQLISSNALTITAWIDPDENDGYNGIFMTRTIDGQTNNSWGLAFENTAASPNHLDSRVDKNPVDSESDTLLPDGGWYHVALVWDGTTGSHTQYINGVESGSATGFLMRQILSTSGPWYIGYDDCCGGARDFNGLIDDIGMWNQALTAQEIAQIYDDGLNGIGIGGPNDPPVVTDLVYNDDDSLTLTWSSQPREGTTYTIFFSDDLSIPVTEWADIRDDIPTQGSTTSFTTGAGFADGVAKRFFVVLQNPN
ncbi:MAG: LamG-like jellyroll fold domain-containing protein [Akkermansiaceae bacterium]